MINLTPSPPTRVDTYSIQAVLPHDMAFHLPEGRSFLASHLFQAVVHSQETYRAQMISQLNDHLPDVLSAIVLDYLEPTPATMRPLSNPVTTTSATTLSINTNTSLQLG